MLITGIGNSFTTRTAFGKENSCNNRQPLTDNKAEDSCVFLNQVSETKSEKTKPAIQAFPTEDSKSIYLLVEDYNQTSIEEIKDKMKEITKENKDIKDITLTVVGVPPSTGELIDEEITDVPELSSIMTRDSIDSLDKSIYKMLGWKRQNTKFD